MGRTVVVKAVGDGGHGNLPGFAVVVSERFRVGEEGQSRISALDDRPVEDETLRIPHV